MTIESNTIDDQSKDIVFTANYDNRQNLSAKPITIADKFRDTPLFDKEKAMISSIMAHADAKTKLKEDREKFLTIYSQLNEDTIPIHLPFHNYAGPGTRTIKNILKGVQPVSYVDKAALIHDIEYYKPDNQLRADANMERNLNKQFMLGLPLHNMVRTAFKLKDIVGYKPKTDLQVYENAKAYVKENYDLGDMRFADDL